MYTNRQDVATKQHKYEGGEYVPDPQFKPTEFPRYLHKRGPDGKVKSLVVKDQAEQDRLEKKGYSVNHPKDEVAAEPDDLAEEAAE